MTDDGYFGEEVAAHYDHPSDSDPSVIGPMIDFLAGYAPAGQALEFAIGTGRVALPLAARGVQVSGIELSRAMASRLRAKSGGEDIPVTIGDMATTRVAGDFDLVFLVYNTINNLVTQDAQVACFANAAAHLRTGGAFVVEVGVPQLQRLPMGERLVPFDLSDRHWGVDEYDVVTQEFWSHHLHIRDGGLRRNSVPFRYVWPSELDLMARLAGLRLTKRVADWTGAPFTLTSPSHVSVWVKD